MERQKSRVVATAREYEAVDFSGVSDPDAATRRLIAATRNLKRQVLRVDRSGRLCTKGFVGLIDAGDVVLEIVPRRTFDSSASEDSDFLLRLLTAAGLVPQSFTLDAHTSVEKLAPLEFVIRAAAQHLAEQLSTHGSPRRYAEVRERSASMLGAVDLTEAMRQLPYERDSIPVVHSPLQLDNPLSQMIKALSEALLRSARSEGSRRILEDVIRRLDGVKSVPLTPDLLTLAKPRVGEEHWRSQHALAHGLLAGVSPNPMIAGLNESRSVLFSLHDVFERILRRAIRHVLKGTHLRLRPKSHLQHFLIDELTGTRRLPLKPDIVVESLEADGDLRIADAKWKSIRSVRGNLTLEPGDVYQLNAYMNRHQVKDGILFVPAMPVGSTNAPAAWLRGFRLLGSDARMSVAFVDIRGLVGRDIQLRRAALGRLGSVLLGQSRAPLD